MNPTRPRRCRESVSGFVTHPTTSEAAAKEGERGFGQSFRGKSSARLQILGKKTFFLTNC